MRKLIESTFLSLDGVTEAPDKWSLFDDEATALAFKHLRNYDAFVIGRVTYENLFANWSDVTGNPYLERINAMPKYVASRSLTEAAPTVTLLGADADAAIAELKKQPGKDLIKYGTGRLDQTLVGQHLIDEFHFWVMPVIVGTGQRLFQDIDTSDLHLELVDQQTLANGTVILRYLPHYTSPRDDATI